MGGLQLTVLGILGEYLGAVFDEVKRRPLYIVDETIGGAALVGFDSGARSDRPTTADTGAGSRRWYTQDPRPILAERNASQRGVARRFGSGSRGHIRKQRR